MIYRRSIKPVLDRLFAAVLLLLLSPILIAIALLIAVLGPHPVLFRQQRAGLNGQPFTIVKFRTMRDGASQLESDATRLTRLGALLRVTSLDELPELWNVLTGDMSLVGPRPLHVRYLERYTPEQARRHDVRPGITGWAQVNGRNAISWEQKFSLDVWYVDHLSATIDARILARTLWKTLAREGMSETGHDTVSEFQGTASQPPLS